MLKDIPRIILKNNNAILSDEENISESKKKIEEDIIKIIEKNGGKIKIGSIKNELKKDNPNFDQKNYGYSKFTKFIGLRVQKINILLNTLFRQPFIKFY